MHTQDYITVLLESLQKKVEVLERIVEKNKVQRLILNEENVNPDTFEENLKGKAGLIDALNKLDDGFQQVYQRVSEALKEDRSRYTEEIRRMQELITKITEMSNMIRVQEQRNKELAEKKFSATKQKIRQVKVSEKAANQYYKNMGKINYIDPQFMDRKK